MKLQELYEARVLNLPHMAWIRERLQGLKDGTYKSPPDPTYGDLPGACNTREKLDLPFEFYPIVKTDITSEFGEPEYDGEKSSRSYKDLANLIKLGKVTNKFSAGQTVWQTETGKIEMGIERDHDKLETWICVSNKLSEVSYPFSI